MRQQLLNSSAGHTQRLAARCRSTASRRRVASASSTSAALQSSDSRPLRSAAPAPVACARLGFAAHSVTCRGPAPFSRSVRLSRNRPSVTRARSCRWTVPEPLRELRMWPVFRNAACASAYPNQVSAPLDVAQSKRATRVGVGAFRRLGAWGIQGLRPGERLSSAAECTFAQ